MQKLTKKNTQLLYLSPEIIAVKEDANKRALNDILSFHVFPGTTLVSGMYPYHLSHVYIIVLQIKIKFTITRSVCKITKSDY